MGSGPGQPTHRGIAETSHGFWGLLRSVPDAAVKIHPQTGSWGVCPLVRPVLGVHAFRARCTQGVRRCRGALRMGHCG